MSELVSAAQMRAIERAAIDGGAVSGLELMERAGAGVVEAVLQEWPELAGAAPGGGAAPAPPRYLDQEEGQLRAVVLCGPGNNGGDGFVVARMLKERGWAVAVFLYGDVGALPVDARASYERWRALGVVGGWDADAIAAARADLFVDAVFGAGLSRAPEAGVMAAMLALGGAGAGPGRLVAVDAPSGVCMDSGRVLGVMSRAARASLTVTFHRMRPGHFLAQGPAHCGRVRCVDIGLEGGGGGGLALAAPAVGDLGKHLQDHKYDYGHALVLAGGPGRGGAARLAARGALRVGAGLVTLGCPPAAMAENAAQLNAIMVREVTDAGALQAVLADERLNALCLGPGLGRDDTARALVAAALAARRACVLDADGLAAFGVAPDRLFALLHDAVVLTPHGGEFARLFPDISEKLAAPAERGPAYSKVDAARAAAARAGCVVLLKGADTVIAAPDGRCRINAAVYERAAPWLATAGSGDVLAGFIAGLLARGFAPMQAAQTGAWLHVECARAFGPGLIAEDLPEALPGVLRDLGV
jgi:ADP-dependent NAD(P)H-hydrate dehydratase / NAD(P)H-hydrate epimerase